MNMTNAPLVSVGVPTYNRPEDLRRMLECLVNQSYKNLEIIVSDNASPNADVMRVVQEFQKEDKRIKFHRQDENKGPADNFQFVLREAGGKYFMWAADDDLLEDFYIADLTDCLESLGDGFVAANFEAQYIDGERKFFDMFPEGRPFYTYSSPNSFDRVAHMLKYNYGNIIYSLYRRETLQRDNLVFAYNEIPFLLQVIQSGNWRVLPRVGFYKQTTPATYKQAKWEKQGGKIPDDSSCFQSNSLKVIVNAIRSTRRYHVDALFNIRKSIQTLRFGFIQRAELNMLAFFIIWWHFLQLVSGYKRRVK